MPNGGMGPCCFICDFAEHTEPRRLVNPLHCQQHDMQVWFPYKHVCGCLMTHGQMPAVVERANIQADIMYAEIEVQYQNPAHGETIPQAYLNQIAREGSPWSRDVETAIFTHVGQACIRLLRGEITTDAVNSPVL
jgi:hypothetical protein